MDKRYEHTTSEPAIRQEWHDLKVYAQASENAPAFTIDTPPPTVSGALHIGHVFSYTHTDIIARYKRMNGFKVFYPFGFDNNGLPTERFVEKQRKIRAHTLSRAELTKMCLEETAKVEATFIDLWRRMGLSANFDHTYSTISAPVQKISQTSFVELYKKGHIYRQEEPALYCTTCRTSISQADLDDVESPSKFSDIVFKGSDGSDLVIGTTRPELLPSCVALLFHPDDKRYQHLKGTNARVPLFEHEVPVLSDEQVDIEKGTGLVMCCTFGDKADVHWYKTLNLPYRQSIGFDGKWVESTGFLAGMKTHDARKAVLEKLAKAGLIREQKDITHTVSVHDRCKKDIEFMVLKQWFIRVLDHKKDLLALADEVNWHPHFMKSRYINWVENLSWDWCISRQRFFGIPFPVWHCNSCDEVILADAADLPIDPRETAPKSGCSKCGSNDITPESDVMDTWNTSSLSPYICASLYHGVDMPFGDERAQSFIPMAMRPQAHDIIRTWAFYTLIKTYLHDGKKPWNEIVISGHVLSGQKEKISKSQSNNPLSPDNLLSRYSADAIRYWTASGSLGHDVAFSEEQIKIGQRLITKLWNAFRFTKEHIASADLSSAPKQLGTINEWLLHRATDCFANYQKELEQYEFSAALAHAERFFWHDFCDNYLELIKDQLFNPDGYPAEEVAATRWTLHHVGLRILQLFAPYVPYVTDALYAHTYRADGTAPSVHATLFESAQQNFSFPESATVADKLLAIVDAIRKLKSTHQLSLKTDIATLTVHTHTEQLKIALQDHIQLLKGVTCSHGVQFVTDTGTTQLVERDGAWHASVNATGTTP